MQNQGIRRYRPFDQMIRHSTQPPDGQRRCACGAVRAPARWRRGRGCQRLSGNSAILGKRRSKGEPPTCRHGRIDICADSDTASTIPLSEGRLQQRHVLLVIVLVALVAAGALLQPGVQLLPALVHELLRRVHLPLYLLLRPQRQEVPALGDGETVRKSDEVAEAAADVRLAHWVALEVVDGE